MSKHQYAMVMDLNKCIGCHTCTMACKKQWTDRDGTGYMYWNNVETQPGEGYPRRWHELGGGFDTQRHLRPSPLPALEDYGAPFEYDYAQRLFEGRNKPVMPHRPPEYAPNWDEDVGGWDTKNPYYFYLPRICNHCTHPACLEACPRKAIYKRTEDGIVVLDQDRCRGYRYCIKACPYKKIYYNEVTRKSEKCIFCYPRLERGRVNACAAQCPGRIRFVGLLDDPASPVHQIVVKHRVALGLFPEKGTHPNVYYVPPFNPPKEGNASRSILEDPRLPMKYLEFLFGPRVVPVIRFLEGELWRAQSGERSEVLQLLIGRDERVRYGLAPAVVATAAPGSVQEAARDRKQSPDLTLMGTPAKTGAGSASDQQHKAAVGMAYPSVRMASAFGVSEECATLGQHRAGACLGGCSSCGSAPGGLGTGESPEEERTT